MRSASGAGRRMGDDQMGKAMSKSDVIYGELRPIAVARFGEADVKNMVDIIRGKIGPKPVISLIQMRDALRKAQADPALKTGRVKVGVIDGDLIWRVKEANFTGPKELDAIVVKNYHTQLSQYLEELQEVANAKAKERLEAEKQKQEETRKPPVKKPVLAKTRSRSSLLSSSESEGDNPLSDSMQREIFRARKAGGMAKAMTDLNAQGRARKREGWTKYNLKAVSREDAEAALKAAVAGSWLVRTGSNGKPVVSYVKGGKMTHDLLDKSIASGGGPRDKDLDLSKAIRPATLLRRLAALGKFQLAMEQVKAMSGFFTNLDGTSAEKKLAGTAVGAWLVRESASQPGVVTWTRRTADGEGVNSFLHTRILKLDDHKEFMDYAQGANRGLQVRA